MAEYKSLFKTSDEQFVNGQIMAQLNLNFLPEKERVELLDRMGEVINQRMLLRIFEQVGKRKKELLAELLDKGSDEELKKFIEENVPNFLDILQETIMELKKDLLAKIGKKR